MGFDSLVNITSSQRTIRIVLLVIILLTLPCYCLGAILLATAPESQATRSGGGTPVPTLGGVTASPTVTPFSLATPTPLGGPLRPTATQLFLYPTVPQIVFPTATITPLPTWTPLPQPTVAPTLTVPPTATLPPTVTLPPTEIPLPTNTPVPPQDTPTMEPTPTQDTFSPDSVSNSSQ